MKLHGVCRKPQRFACLVGFRLSKGIRPGEEKGAMKKEAFFRFLFSMQLTREPP